MQRFARTVLMTIALAVILIPGCGGGNDGGPERDTTAVDTTTVDSMAAARGGIGMQARAVGDTMIRYDNPPLFASGKFARTDTVGVWVSPPSNRPCTLRTVQVQFDTSSRETLATVIVYRAGLYPNKPFATTGPVLAAVPFQIPNGFSNSFKTVDINLEQFAIQVPAANDLFIGVTMGGASTAQSNLVLNAGSAKFGITARSYRFGRNANGAPQRDTLLLNFSVRPTFGCQVAAPADTQFTFTLRWATKRTDLDLYLIYPPKDSISKLDTLFWGRRVIGKDSLDGDDNDGEGPEDIVYHRRFGNLSNTIRLAVHYAGPKGGPDTKATVFGYAGRNDTNSIRIGTCTMKVGDWWEVAQFDPTTGVGFPTSSTCRRVVAPAGVRTKLKATPR